MDILDEHYTEEDCVFVFDNAITHTKRAEGALSARYMPKSTCKWGVEVNLRGVDGKPVYGPNGKIIKHKVKMHDATFGDSSPQLLYFDSRPQSGLFKCTTDLLQERGLDEEAKLKAQCKNFKCPTGNKNCCQHRVLYHQPDLVQEKSLLEQLCEECGYTVLFLPKFHCELNFIEQFWGFAKCMYQKFPASSKEADLEINVLTMLESVPLESMNK